MATSRTDPEFWDDLWTRRPNLARWTLPLIKRAVAILAELPLARVDEYGFGTTHLAEALVKDKPWRGFDFSPVAVANAKAKGLAASVSACKDAERLRRSYVVGIALLPNLTTEERDIFLERVSKSPHAIFGIKRHTAAQAPEYSNKAAFAEFLRQWWPHVEVERIGPRGILAHCMKSVPPEKQAGPVLTVGTITLGEAEDLGYESRYPETTGETLLTVGSSTLLDFRGVHDTIAGLQTNHGEFGGKVEYVLVDNHPEATTRLRGCKTCQKTPDGEVCSECAKDLEDMEVCATSEGARYVRWSEKQGTYPGKNQLKVEARGKWVLTMDSHVKLTPWAIEECLELIEREPESNDFFHFPNLFRSGNRVHAGRASSADFRNQQWIYHGGDDRGGVYGWTRNATTPGEPYPIAAMITSCYLVRKDAWFSAKGYDPILGNYGGWEGPIQLKWWLMGRQVRSMRYTDPARMKASPQGFLYHWHLFNHFRRLANATGRIHTGHTKMRNFAASSAVIGGEPWVRRHCELKAWDFDSQWIQTGFAEGMKLRPWMVSQLARPEWEDITEFFRWMRDEAKIPGALQSW
jgi:hypothetical protein